MVLLAVVMVVVGVVSHLSVQVFYDVNEYGFSKLVLLAITLLTYAVGFTLVLYIGVSALAAIAGIH